MQLIQTAPGCKYSIVARVDTTIYSPDQTWTLDVPAGQHDFIAETNEIIIPGAGDAMMCPKAHQIDEDTARVNILGEGAGSPATFIARSIEQIVGKGNAKVVYGAGKATIVLALSVTAAQAAEVKKLLERLLPKDVVMEMEWADGLPTTYTKLEYLESTGTQWIDTGIKAAGTLKIGLDVEAVKKWNNLNLVFGSSRKSGNIAFSMDQNNEYARAGLYHYGSQTKYFYMNAHKLNVRYKYEFDGNVVYRDGKLFPFLNNKVMTKEDFVSTSNILLFASFHDNNGRYRTAWKKVYSFSIFDNVAGIDVPLLNYVPALDSVTKQPGMFDTISKEFKTNAGTGEFIYPGKETEATTYSLRNRMYGKITEHGIRRLYCVPEGYNSKEEYAEENGFKLLIETPMPEEGHWESVWHDREDCIELEWVEIEPPTEEVTEND